ncbi:MAG: DegV family protein, partial [Bacteroidota bacterium]
MTKIALVTDSTTAMPVEMAKELEHYVAPVVLMFGEEELRDSVDIQPAEFYKRLAISEVHPTTSQPIPNTYKEIYDKLLAEGNEILVLPISSKLSGSYQSAVMAKEMLPDAPIEVVDTLSGAMAVGLILQRIQKAINAGKSLQECKELAEDLKDNVGVFITVDTLDYLHKGGRIGAASKFLGTALKFRPVLEVKDGEFVGHEKVRTTSKAVERMIEYTLERIDGRKPLHISIMHADAEERAGELLNMLKDR